MLLTRASKHMENSNLTGKRIESTKEVTISNGLLQCASQITFASFDVLAFNSDNFRLLLKKSLLIKRDKPVLNRKIK